MNGCVGLRFLPVFIGVISVLLVVVIILGVVIIHLLTSPSQISFRPLVSPTSTATTVSSQIGATPTIVAPTPSPTSTSGSVLCQADWSNGLNGWIGTPDWKTLNSVLINDGTNGGSQDPPTLLAPCDLNSVPNYRVEVKIQMQSQGYDPGFGFYVRYRSDSNSGYMVGNTTAYGGCSAVCSLSIAPTSDFYTPIENIKFVPGTVMRTYTIEMKDNHIKVFIDGGFVTDVTDNRSLSGGSVGFWDKDVQLAVSS